MGFCVLDLDRIVANATEKRGYFAEKSKIKVNKGIEFIETMPCVELWFLLHFLDRYSAKAYVNYDQISKPLKQHITRYEKTSAFFKSNPIYELLITKGNLKQADEFARKLAIEKDDSDNPYFNFTDINKLIKRLKNR